MVVGVDPLLGEELDLAGCHRLDRALGNAAPVLARLVHRDKPLVGQHRLDHLAGALATRHHQLVLFYLDQQAQRIEIGDDLFARHEAIQAAVFKRRH